MTKEQKKIIYLGAFTLVFIFFFWLFVYAPQAKKFASIRERLIQAEDRISHIQSIAKAGDLARGISQLNATLDKTAKVLPKDEAAAIYNFSDTARKLGIQMKSTATLERRFLEDKITGCDIEELAISMGLVGEYRALGEYLNILTTSFPVLVRVKELNIQARSEGQPSLDVTLRVLAYLSREK